MRHIWQGLLYVRNQTSPTPTMLYNVNILKRTAANSHEKVLNATNRPTCQHWSCFLILLVLTQTLDRYVASHKPCSSCNYNSCTTRLCHTHLSAHIVTGQLREVNVLRQSTCSQTLRHVCMCDSSSICAQRLSLSYYCCRSLPLHLCRRLTWLDNTRLKDCLPGLAEE